MDNISLSKQKQFWIFAAITFCSLALAMALQQVLWIAIPFAVLGASLAIANTQIIYYLLIAAVPISINLLQLDLMSLDFPDEPLMLIITALLPLLFLQLKDKFFVTSFINHPLISIMIIWIVWIGITCITSTYPLLSIKYLLAKIWYVVPFLGMTTLVVYNSNANIKKIFLLYFVPLVLMVLFVIYRHSKLGFTFEDVTAACSPYFVNHVSYGSLVSLFVPICVGVMLMQKTFSFKWWLMAGMTILFLVAVYLAYSRGAWAAVFFAACLVVAIRLRLVHYFFILFYITITSAVFFLNTQNKYIDFAPHFETGIMHDNLVDHLIATIKGKDISSNERFYRWVAGARMSMLKPIVGYGPNTFYENYKTYTVSNFRTYVSRNEERSTMHNYFLFMLVEQGFVGMGLYALFIFMIFYKGQQLYHTIIDRQLKLVVMSVLCMNGAFFINNTLSELIENDKLGACFFIGIGIIVALQIKYPTDRKNKKEIVL
jgi:O-antigen ligase